MSAFLMSDEFFVQLNIELRERIESENFLYSIREFCNYQYRDLDYLASLIHNKIIELRVSNNKAVNYRYGIKTPLKVLKLKDGISKWSDVQLFKHLQCLSYQMAEGSVIKSKLYRDLNVLLGNLAENIISSSSEYKSCKWDY